MASRGGDCPQNGVVTNKNTPIGNRNMAKWKIFFTIVPIVHEVVIRLNETEIFILVGKENDVYNHSYGN
jgi:hypothetical protein